MKQSKNLVKIGFRFSEIVFYYEHDFRKPTGKIGEKEAVEESPKNWFLRWFR